MLAILRFTPSLSPETSAVSKPAPAVYKNLSATEKYNPPRLNQLDMPTPFAE